MKSSESNSKAGYAENADALAAQYETITFAETHRQTLHLLPDRPSRILDIGAGSGRDAAALAALGHTVVAVEPTVELRRHGERLHAGAKIEWLDDELPDLDRVIGRGETYDRIYLTAVWMHLDAAERKRGMPRLRQLTAPDGLVIMSLRHGPIPEGRRMFDVSAEETVELASRCGFAEVFRADREDMLGRHDVRWSLLALQRCSDGASPPTR